MDNDDLRILAGKLKTLMHLTPPEDPTVKELASIIRDFIEIVNDKEAGFSAGKVKK
jgi:hypothetical protein